MGTSDHQQLELRDAHQANRQSSVLLSKTYVYVFAGGLVVSLMYGSQVMAAGILCSAIFHAIGAILFGLALASSLVEMYYDTKSTASAQRLFTDPSEFDRNKGDMVTSTNRALLYQKTSLVLGILALTFVLLSQSITFHRGIRIMAKDKDNTIQLNEAVDMKAAFGNVRRNLVITGEQKGGRGLGQDVSGAFMNVRPPQPIKPQPEPQGKK